MTDSTLIPVSTIANLASGSQLTGKQPPASSQTDSNAKQRRYKLWQLPANSHCMIIGTCLTLQEVKQIAKKCRYPTDGKSDYDLHHFFVYQAGHTDSVIARKTHSMLEKKFRTDVTRVRSCSSPANLLEHWEGMKQTGRIAGTLWAVITHPECDSGVLQTIYGEVHMMSHLAGASYHQQLAELPNKERSIASKQSKINNQKSRWNSKLLDSEKTIKRLEAENRKLREKLERMEQDSSVSYLQNSTDSIDHRDYRIVRSMLSDTNNTLKETRQQLRDANRQVHDQQQQLQQSTHDMQRMERLVNYLMDKGEACNTDDSCDQTLSGKCVLMLGGMPSQCRHFKAFVESNDGDFLHHDGGVETNYAQIDQLISRADAVFCPVEQVSHSAMLRAKRLCKKTDKPMVFLPKASLSAFVNGIRQIPSHS
jgi:hypothetical protein